MGGGVGRLAPAGATPLPRRWLYPAVNGGSPRRGRDADAVVLKSSLWKQDGEGPGREMENRKGGKEQAHHSAVRKSFFHLILDFQGLRCKLFMQLHPMLKLVIHNLQRLTSKQSSI